MWYRFHFVVLPALLLVASCGLRAQTAIDLKSQSRNIDFTAAGSTRPFKTGTVLPAACAVGETFFKSNATAGQNLYGCTATNTWSQMSSGLSATGVTAGTYGAATLVPVLTVDTQGRVTSASQVAVQGGGGSLPSMTSQAGKYLNNDGTNPYWQRVGVADIGDCSATLSGGVITVAACAARNGSLDVTVAACTVSLTGSTSSGTLHGYLSVDGTFTMGHNSASTLACAGWTAVSGVSVFPSDALPLFSATFSSNAWNSNGMVNYRRLIARDPYVAGDGLQTVNNTTSGITAMQVDASLIPRYFTGAGAPALNCTQGRDFYLDTAAAALYQCTASNTWGAVGGGGGATITARRYPPWGFLSGNGGNPTGVFTANETRWQQFHLLAGMTVSGAGLRAWNGIGASKGLRFAIANTAGTILHKTAVLTTCNSNALCEAALPGSVTLPAGVYYLGITTDSASLQTGQLSALLDGTLMCAASNIANDPKVAGNGTGGSGTAGSVDFGAGMGTLTAHACNSGTNNLILKFHDVYFY